MKPWSTWLPDVRPHVAGCPDLLAEHELRRAAQEFFRRSRAWRVRRPGVIAVSAGTSVLTLSTGDTTQDLVRVEALRYDGRALDPVTPELLDMKYGDAWEEHTGTPNKFLQETP
ncbi:MAG TPA: hypothetical protein VK305_00655, partial [Roseateles sp.]|nr:hypothetical protein [Roseateles sp.]